MRLELLSDVRQHSASPLGHALSVKTSGTQLPTLAYCAGGRTRVVVCDEEETCRALPPCVQRQLLDARAATMRGDLHTAIALYDEIDAHAHDRLGGGHLWTSVALTDRCILQPGDQRHRTRLSNLLGRCVGNHPALDHARAVLAGSTTAWWCTVGADNITSVTIPSAVANNQ